MKRYQCIKNVFYPKADPATGRMIPTLSFKAGSVYPCRYAYPGEFDDMVDDNGNTHIATHEFLNNFQELLDLHVDDYEAHGNDQEELDNAMDNAIEGFARSGLIICIAAVITTGLILYLALTWRS
jgi:hypothetical protein